MNNEFDIIVVGAGPAGIMAAIFAARNKKRVLLLDKNDKIGRKSLATGNGRCNLTNENVSVDNYNGNTRLIRKVLSSFDQHQTINFFESLGVILKTEARGRVFPYTNQASTLVEALEYELRKNNVTIITGFEVKKITPLTNHWVISNDHNKSYSGQKLVITTGGKAAFQFGSSGDGLYWVSNLGHTISPIFASLVPVETIEEWPKELQGIKVEAEVSISDGNKKISNRFGDLLFTHFGISGPAIMGQARKIGSEISQNRNIFVKIDLFPSKENSVLDNILANIFMLNGAKEIKNALVGIIPTNMAPVILKISGVDTDKKSAEITKEERQRLVNNLKELTLTVKKLRPLKEAQVTAGGINSSEIGFDTLESKIVKNLYFAGEILDIDGESGGFNLQWAWSSGRLAGVSASK